MRSVYVSYGRKEINADQKQKPSRQFYCLLSTDGILHKLKFHTPQSDKTNTVHMDMYYLLRSLNVFSLREKEKWPFAILQNDNENSTDKSELQ